MPVIPVTAIKPGWHTSTVEGFTYRSSTSNGNPMVEVDITLDTGELTSLYIVISTDGRALADFLAACGEPEIARAILYRKNPSFELDDLIGRKLWVHVSASGLIHTV